jgi:hypothetical protein
MKQNKIRLIGILLFFVSFNGFCQIDTATNINDRLDDQYIDETEGNKESYKVLHAEPLFIDLIRDLGARKGEKEWNVGIGLTDNNKYDRYEALVEYEWAPINRLGFEVELPFSFYYPVTTDVVKDSIPGNKLNSIKLATQWSFFVSEKMKTSMALGYIHEFEMHEFKEYNQSSFFMGNLYNPFFVTAKRWGQNFHTLIYSGPKMLSHHGKMQVWAEVNTNLHYMIDGTRNFIGIEFNKEIYSDDFDMTIRPQMRISLAENIIIGIVTGIPIKRENDRFSSFLRLIYEPGHKHKHE